MTVIFGKVHDLTATDVACKLIDLYTNVAHDEVAFTFTSVKMKKYTDGSVILELSPEDRNILEMFESSVLENMEDVFDGKLSGLSLAKLYMSSVTDEGLIVNLEDEDIDMFIDDDETYMVSIVCDHVFIVKGNSGFGSPLKMRSRSVVKKKKVKTNTSTPVVKLTDNELPSLTLEPVDPVGEPLDGGDEV